MVGESSNIYGYTVDEYSDLLISVPLKQLNFNTNPRSTIATYYGIDKYLKYIFAESQNLDVTLFSFNKFSSCCKTCKGVGFELESDISLIVDYDSSLSEIPFIPWRNSFKEYYKQLLSNISVEKNIPTNIPFRELNDDIKQFLLRGTGKEKYKIKYTQNGRKREKSSVYQGVLNSIDTSLNKGEKEYLNFSRKKVCSKCKGSRFSNKIERYKFVGESIGDIYLMKLPELVEWINVCKNDSMIDRKLIKMLDMVLDFVNKLMGMNLEYVNLNRSISTLSGGEFQRLRLSQFIDSKFKQLLYVLDEPLSNLHVSEKKYVIEKMEKLSRNNTLLVVEHNIDFVSTCDKVIALGKSGGCYGGKLISSSAYLEKQQDLDKIEYKYSGTSLKLTNTQYVNNVKPFEMEFPINSCIGVAGVSGSGKTTFIKEILPKLLENYKYISQKPIRGNSYSIVASYINILEGIRNLFAKKNNVPKSLFSFHYNGDGACKRCKGTGVINIENYGKKTYSYMCPECEGKKFNNKALSYTYKEHSIYDVLNFEVLEAIDFFEGEDKKILKALQNAKKIGLGYLKLNQSIGTLSGGENQRVKLLKHVNLNHINRIIALDEPFQGLSRYETNLILRTLYEYVERGNTIIFVEHDLYALSQCSYIIEFGKGSGNNGGNIIFNGKTIDIFRSSKSVIKEYIRL